MSLETQAHVCNVLRHTLHMAFEVAYKNKNIAESEHRSIQSDLANAKDSDVTVVSRFFRNRYDYLDSRGYHKNGSLIGIFINIELNHRNLLLSLPNLKADHVKTFIQQLKELDPLVQNIKYYRNYFSHKLKSINQIGWNVAVISSVIRLCEIGTVKKEDQNSNQENISKFKNALSLVLNVDRPMGDFSNVTISSKDANTALASTQQIDSIIDEIKSSEQNLLTQISKMNVISIQAKPNEEIKPKTPTALTLDTYDTQDVTEQEQEQEQSIFVESITPEILRQNLKALSTEIKSQFEGDRSFGASSNLLQIANIGEILQHEPQDLNGFLALPSVTSRTNLSSDSVMQQITDHGEKIDDLLKSVLWSSLFES